MFSYSRNYEVGSMGVGAGLYMYGVVVKKFTFAISSPDEFLLYTPSRCKMYCGFAVRFVFPPFILLIFNFYSPTRDS